MIQTKGYIWFQHHLVPVLPQWSPLQLGLQPLSLIVLQVLSKKSPRKTLKIGPSSASDLNVLKIKSSVDDDSFKFDDSDDDSLSASVTSGSPTKDSPEKMQLSTPIGTEAMAYSPSSDEDSDDETKDPTFHDSA